MGYLRGIDVSNHQGQIDWPQVATAGLSFAGIKASEGDWFTDAYFAANMAGARAANLVRLPYHFARPGQSAGPEAEAEHFLSCLGDSLEPGDLVVLDLESGEGDVSDWASTWLTYVEQRVGHAPAVYSARWFLKPHGCTENPELAAYPLWCASYPSGPPNVWPDAPPAWPGVTIWQYSDKGSVPGIAGNVDMDLYRGSADELRALGKPAAAGEPPKGDDMDDATKAAVARYLAEMVDLACGMRDDRCHEVIARAQLIANAIGVDVETKEEPMVQDPNTGTGTGQDIDSYLPLYDLPDEEIMARDGLPLVAVWAIKDGLQRAGKTLRYPPPADHAKGWHVFPAGQPVPANWQELLSGGG